MRIKGMRKVATRFLGALALGILLTGCTVFGIRSGTEQPVYTVEEKLSESVEIRRYDTRVYAEARVETGSGNHRNKAFRLLFNYISGGNTSADKIAMTVPVTSGTASEEIAMTVPVTSDDQGVIYTMRFFLPSSYTLETAPVPGDPAVTIGALPPRMEAVLTYSGTTSESEVDRRKAELRKVLDASDWSASGEPVAYFYDPPWTLPFLKRNEVTVTVEQ